METTRKLPPPSPLSKRSKERRAALAIRRFWRFFDTLQRDENPWAYTETRYLRQRIRSHLTVAGWDDEGE